MNAFAMLALAAGLLRSEDYYKLRSVGSVALSPDGSSVAYSVVHNGREGRPYRQLWISSLDGGRHIQVGGEADRGNQPEWSPHGRLIAFAGKISGKDGLHVVKPDGSGIRFLGEMKGTNSPLTYEGSSIAWSPDSKRIAFVSTTPGPETELANGDPMVITRYKYRPDYWEGSTRFNDNRRRHIFVVDVDSGASRQLTPDGIFEEHSIDWSPRGEEILFVSNREPDPDLFYNADIFAVRVADGTIRRLSATESAEFEPRWSPDGQHVAFMGTRRGLTDLETDMEDTHVWTIDREGGNRRELGAGIDNRQSSPTWSPDGRFLYFSVEERGHERLYRMPSSGGAPEVVVNEPGRVLDWSIAGSTVAYAFQGLDDLAQLYVEATPSPRKLTDLNQEALAGVGIAGQLAREEFQGHRVAEPDVLGPEDLPHAPS
ncbi:MAG TPA: hypothetical protein VIE88_13270, partial [Vicinamibacteria bacterium]